MRKIFPGIIFILIIVLPSITLGAVHHIRAGAVGAGDGADWINAYTQLPPVLVRGDVYYIADGNYGGYEFNDAVSGSTHIKIIKATDSDHGIANGWQSSYGDGVAVFQGALSFFSDYWILDGQTGGGPGQWTSGFGFEVRPNWTSTERAGRAIFFDRGVGNIELKSLNIHPSVVHQGYGHLFYGFNVHDVSVTQSYGHDNWGTFFLMRNWSNILIEKSYFRNNQSTSDYHAEAISDGGSDDLTIRFNHWVDVDGTAIFASINNFGPSERWDIYGNLFYSTDQSSAQFVSGTIRVINDATNNASAYDWKFHHNTIANLEGWFGGGIIIDAGSNNIARNNIFWANGTLNSRTMLFRGIDLDYNLYDVEQIRTPSEPNGQYLPSSPFISFANFNFELAYTTAPGVFLASPYDVDLMNRNRGDDGIIDRGALEFQGVPDTVAPGSPTILEVIVVNPSS